MAVTYKLIQTQTLGSSVATVTFSAIPQTYTDLLLLVSGRSDRASVVDDVKITINGVTTNMTQRSIAANGASVTSASDTAIYGSMNGNNATSTAFGLAEFYFVNYTSSTNAKSVSIEGISETNGTTAYIYLNAALWNPGTQAAITTLACTSYNAANFLTNSVFSLYGIKNS